MWNKIAVFFFLENKKNIINILSLAIIQVSNAVSPLVIFPLVLSIVGSDNYSFIALSESFNVFLITFVIYSFEVDGVSRIVGLNHKDDANSISNAISEIVSIRLILFLLGSLFLLSIILVFDEKLIVLSIGWTLVSLSYAVQPNWLCQGLEFNFPVALTNVISRLGAFITIFLCIKEMSDFVYVPYILGTWYFSGSIISLLFVSKFLGFRFVVPNLSNIIGQIKMGRTIFLSNIGTAIYRDTGILLLGYFGVSGAGISSFSIADKLVRALQASVRPINQFSFPLAVRIAKEENKLSKRLIFKLLKLILPQELILLCAISMICLLWFAATHYEISIGEISNLSQIANLTIIMSIGTLFGISNYILGSAGLNVLNKRKALFKSIIFVGCLSVVLNVIGIRIFEEKSTAVVFVLSEFVLFICIILQYVKNKSATKSLEVK